MNQPLVPQPLLLQKTCQCDWGGPPIPSTIQYYPQLRSTTPHLHCTKCWCVTSSPACGAGHVASISSTVTVASLKIWVFASVTTWGATCSAGWFPSAPWANQPWEDYFFSLTAFLTFIIHHCLWILPGSNPSTTISYKSQIADNK